MIKISQDQLKAAEQKCHVRLRAEKNVGAPTNIALLQAEMVQCVVFILSIKSLEKATTYCLHLNNALCNSTFIILIYTFGSYNEQTNTT